MDGLAKDINADNPPNLSTGGFGGITLAINMKSEHEVDTFVETVIKYGGTVAKKVFWGGYADIFKTSTATIGKLPTAQTGSSMKMICW